MQSPLHQNGELPISPPPIDPTQSPPPLFHSRDHITKSPPIPGLPPPPFLPPPLGGSPFIPPPPLDGMMPPPLGEMPPFMHGLPPAMFPGKSQNSIFLFFQVCHSFYFDFYHVFQVLIKSWFELFH